MKVEKCPRCGADSNIIKGILQYFRWRWSVVCNPSACSCADLQHAWCKLVAIIKWNRWARRETKRIAKEGKGK